MWMFALIYFDLSTPGVNSANLYSFFVPFKGLDHLQIYFLALFLNKLILLVSKNAIHWSLI